MATPKFFNSLATLDKDERKSFKQCLSLHIREGSDPDKCYQYLHKQADNLQKADFDEVVRKKHFTKLTSKAFSNLLSKLQGHFESWLSNKMFLEEPYEKEILLVKGLNQRGLYQQADQVFNKTLKQLKNEQHIDLYQHRVMAALYREQYYSNNPIKKEKWQTIYKELLEYQIKTQMEQSALCLLEATNIEGVRPLDFQIEKQILRTIAESQKDSKLSEVILTIVNYFQDEGDEQIEDLLDHLETDRFDNSSDLFLILTAYIRRIVTVRWKKGGLENQDLYSRSIHLCLEATEQNPRQKFNAQYLFNCVSALAHFETEAYMEALIDKWSQKVHTAYPESVKRYCKALVAFRNDKYEKIPSLLNNTTFDLGNYKLGSYLLNLIAQYKLGEEDLTTSMITNFRKQLKRNSNVESDRNIRAMYNTTRFITDLMKSKYQKNLQLDLINYNPIFYKTWAAKQIE